VSFVRNWLHRFVVVVALLAILCVTATTTAFAARYTYDAASIARVDAHAGGGSGSGSAQFSGVQVAPPLAHTEAQGASTTFLTADVATESGPSFYRGAKPGEAPSFEPRPIDFKVDPHTACQCSTTLEA
jgi:hypothetical protein